MRGGRQERVLPQPASCSQGFVSSVLGLLSLDLLVEDYSTFVGNMPYSKARSFHHQIASLVIWLLMLPLFVSPVQGEWHVQKQRVDQVHSSEANGERRHAGARE